MLPLLLWTPVRAADSGNSDVEVKVRVDGRAVEVMAHFMVAATPQEVWAVFTDFENMHRFVSNLESSELLLRQGNLVHVQHKGRARFGPLSFRFESVRELTLSPYERIRSRQISGTLVSMEGETLIIAAGSATQVVHHASSVSNQDIPPIIGPAFIRSETEEQFTEIQTEILRRRQATKR